MLNSHEDVVGCSGFDDWCMNRLWIWHMWYLLAWSSYLATVVGKCYPHTLILRRIFDLNWCAMHNPKWTSIIWLAFWQETHHNHKWLSDCLYRMSLRYANRSTHFFIWSLYPFLLEVCYIWNSRWNVIFNHLATSVSTWFGPSIEKYLLSTSAGHSSSALMEHRNDGHRFLMTKWISWSSDSLNI